MCVVLRYAINGCSCAHPFVTHCCKWRTQRKTNIFERVIDHDWRLHIARNDTFTFPAMHPIFYLTHSKKKRCFSRFCPPLEDIRQNKAGKHETERIYEFKRTYWPPPSEMNPVPLSSCDDVCMERSKLNMWFYPRVWANKPQGHRISSGLSQ